MSAFKLPVFTAQCTTTEYFDMQILSTANERGVLPGRECLEARCALHFIADYTEHILL